MAVRAPIEQTEGLYFITFTCCQWHPLFEIIMDMRRFINGSIT